MLQLSARTTTRRIELIARNLEAKLANDEETCEFFSIQLDESTDAVDTAKLAISVKMVFDDFSTKEEFLKILPLTARTQGKDIFSLFKKFAIENKLPLQKLSSITTDGARAMTAKENGFIGLCRKDPLFPKFIAYHCLIHQEILFAKTINFNHIMSIVTKIINSIKAKATQHKVVQIIFRERIHAEFKDFLLHTEVTGGSLAVKFLNASLTFYFKYKEFVASRNEVYEELENKNWL
ncbi:protein ZBED8 [Trichonephila clavipes]|nr:protein ZBED8 [Trichonephila clavipes]